MVDYSLLTVNVLLLNDYLLIVLLLTYIMVFADGVVTNYGSQFIQSFIFFVKYIAFLIKI